MILLGLPGVGGRFAHLPSNGRPSTDPVPAVAVACVFAQVRHNEVRPFVVGADGSWSGWECAGRSQHGRWWTGWTAGWRACGRWCSPHSTAPSGSLWTLGPVGPGPDHHQQAHPVLASRTLKWIPSTQM